MGLARPLLSRALLLMRDLGARRIVIPTQTTTWLACRLYLDFGFTPIPQNLIRSELGWRMIRRLTDHPALSSLTPATLPEMFPELFRTDQHPEEVQEHSCGCMVLGKQKEQTQCLLLLSNKNEWGFPKGHVEIGEHERDTALRELWEETGLRANLVPHFRRETIYLTDTVGKRVTYFLAAADPRVPIHIQDTEEIREACWLEPEDALDRLIREDRRELLSQALTYWAGVTR